MNAHRARIGHPQSDQWFRSRASDTAAEGVRDLNPNLPDIINLGRFFPRLVRDGNPRKGCRRTVVTWNAFRPLTGQRFRGRRSRGIESRKAMETGMLCSCTALFAVGEAGG